MKAIILAAGYATRLYPLTLNKPKALFEIAGKPLIEHIIEKIPKEIDEIYIVTNSKFINNFQNWLQKFSCSRNIELIDDGSTDNSNRLGGIGDMDFAVNNLGLDDFLVIASDNIFDFSLEKAFRFFNKNRKDLIIVYDVKSKKEARKFGVVILDENKKIKKFFEKPKKPGTTIVSTGIYFFTKNSILLLKDYLEEDNSREGPGLFMEWLLKRKKIYAFPLEGKWYDIGSMESYEEAKKSWRKDKKCVA